jgi:uncharacterized protein
VQEYKDLMRNIFSEKEFSAMLSLYASDIIASDGMQCEKKYMHHMNVSCYDHSVAVARMSILIALRFNIDVDMKSLLRGALLHDYFLYDWHEPDKSHRLHGFYHAACALKNAERDFNLTPVERDIIVKHMFPLNPHPPRCPESFIVTTADKICAVREIFSSDSMG